MHKPDIDPEARYTVAEVAEILKLHPETVREWVRDGKLRAVFIGRGYSIEGSEIERVMREGTAHSAYALHWTKAS
jgi:excisionase family DNA binding protein